MTSEGGLVVYKNKYSFCSLKFVEGGTDRLKRELAKPWIIEREPHAPIAFLACSRVFVQNPTARMYTTDQIKKCGLFFSLDSAGMNGRGVGGNIDLHTWS